MPVKAVPAQDQRKARGDAESPVFNWPVAGWLAFTLLLCTHFTLCYNAIPDYLNLDEYTRGAALTPYQFRALPIVIFRMFAQMPFVSAVARHAPAQFHNPYQVVQIGMVLCCIFAAVLAMCGTLSKLTDNRWFSRWFSLVLVYMAYFNLAPGWGLSYSFPYDVPSLMFFSLGVYLIVSNRLWLYYLMFPIAVFNRETTCFLTIFFVIWNLDQARDRASTISRKNLFSLGGHVLAQAILWLAVKVTLAHLFAGNQSADTSVNGHFFSIRLIFNLHELIEPQQWPVYLSCCGFLLPALWFGRRWIQCPPIARACAIILPLWFAGMMMVGVVPEIRIFSELSVFIVPALGLIVYNRLRTGSDAAADGPHWQEHAL